MFRKNLYKYLKILALVSKKFACVSKFADYKAS